jgi:peptidoglycan hydrolase-like protein with peptidoglycan-binding domain
VQPDLAAPERWLESHRRSRSRRFAAARAATHRRLKRRGSIALIAAMTLGSGAALAAGTTQSSPTAATASPTVSAIQRALGIPADGISGPQTRRAVKRFQRSHGLQVDGVAGPATIAALGLTGTASVKLTSASGVLARIAQCESGGNPTAVSADGRYHGKYLFSRAPWRALGGSGDPAAAPESEQDARAAQLYARRGTQPWPVCGRDL